VKRGGIVRIIDKISDVSGKLAAWIIIPNVLALVYEVFSRYLFNSPTIWSYEVTYFLYAAHFILGAAFALKERAHTRVEVFYSRRSERTQALINCLGYIILFFPAMILIIYGGIDFVKMSYEMGERSAVSAWRPLMWPFRAILPIGMFLLLLQGIAEFIKAVPIAIGGRKHG